MKISPTHLLIFKVNTFFNRYSYEAAKHMRDGNTNRSIVCSLKNTRRDRESFELKIEKKFIIRICDTKYKYEC